MRRLLSAFLSGIILLLLPGLVLAQQEGTVAGTVVDSDTEEPLPGANIQIVGLDIGQATNAEGEFSISGVPAGEQVLQVSFVGYEQEEQAVDVPAGGRAEVQIGLSPEAGTLEEVVVTGQGSEIEKKRLSTTTETISGENLDEVSTGRLDQALQSQLPNAQIRLNSGQPGTTSLIRSRGPVSSSGNTTPVIYIDGVRVDNRSSGSPLDIATGGAASSSIADIPLENIERVEFVKGGAATTLYGSDAANGVLQIFTKDGTGSQDQLNFETRLGAEVGTRDFFDANRTGEVIFNDPALVQSYTLSGSGSASGLNYSFSGKMYDNDAARVGNENIRYDLNTRVSATPLEEVRYSGSVNFVSNRFTRAINANSTFTSLRTENALFFGEPVDSLSEDQFQTIRDSLREADRMYDNVTEVRRWQTSQTLRYNPVSSVEMKLTAGLDYRTENNKEITTNEFLRQVGSPSAGSQIQDFTRDFLGLTLEGNMNHEASWKFLDFESTVGFQIFRDETKITLIQADEQPDGAENVGAAAQTQGFDNLSTVAQQGIYAKENVGFGDRFFIDLGIRGDNNSAFGEQVGTQWYPSIGASYTLTDESFVADNISTDVLSNLKLRANYGESGNFPNAFANERTTNPNALLGTVSFTFGNPGNSDLGPERVQTWEAGGDVGFFNDRVTVQVTRYNSTTIDALFNPPFAPSTGQNNQQRNIGRIENKGWEFSSQFALLDQQDYGLNLDASLNTLTNEVVDAGGTPKFNTGGFAFLGTFVEEGKPVGYLEGDQPIYDEDGFVEDWETDAFLGDPNPDKFGSVSLSGRYKGLSLRATADYQTGAQGIAVTDVLRLAQPNQDDHRFPNPNDAVHPALEGTAFAGLDPAVQQVVLGQLDFFQLAGAYVEDTDYLKVRSINLNYQIPESILPSRVRSIRIGGGVQNPFNFVESSFDPEVTGINGGGVGGVFGYRTISPPRQYTFTMNIGL